MTLEHWEKVLDTAGYLVDLYFFEGQFMGDVLTSFCDVDVALLTHIRNPKLRKHLPMMVFFNLTDIVRQRIVGFVVESSFSCSRSSFLVGAARLSYYHRFIQKDMYNNSVPTRVVRWVLSKLSPWRLWRSRRPEATTTSPVLSQEAAAAKANVEEMQNYARELRTEAYQSSSVKSVASAVLQTNLVSEVSSFIVDQAQWTSMYITALWQMKSRGQLVSSWKRLFRFHISTVVANGVETVLGLAARVVGASIGHRVYNRPNAAGAFWGEYLLLAVASSQIYRASLISGAFSLYLLENLIPVDVEEEKAEQETTQEEQAREEACQVAASGEHDLYALLGVAESASTEEIKKAYRSLSLQHHPDRSARKAPEEAEKSRVMMVAINEANDVLCSDSKRAAYDNARFMTKLTGPESSDTWKFFATNGQEGTPPPLFTKFMQLPKPVQIATAVTVMASCVCLGFAMVYEHCVSRFYRQTSLGRLPIRFATERNCSM